MSTQYEIRQWENYEGNKWWNWAVWIEGTEEALNEVAFVEWILHPTFPNPVRVSKDRLQKFRLETGGWGVFPIHARISTKDGRSEKLSHHLQLHYEDGKENTD
jgi:transcription initiation factor IIF auxiliary subunit